ncbi:MAG: hypothetical protein RJB38_2365 [Pseudomonadota bacterium]|jgi:dTDP-4-dehydrorhamnose reductase
MRKKSVLIIGGSGYVGTSLALRLRDECKVFATHYRHPLRIGGVSAIPLGLNNPEWIKTAVLNTQADSVIYLAGTDRRSDAGELELIYSSAALVVLGAVSILGARFIYLSHASIYDGAKGNYKPTDAPLTRSSWGRAQLAAENGIRSRAIHYAIIRSSPSYGLGPNTNPSFTDRLIFNLATGRGMELDDVEVHSFTPIQALVETLAGACLKSEVHGFYHHSGAEPCTQLSWGKRLAEYLGLPSELLRAKQTGEDTETRNLSLDGMSGATLSKMEPLLLEQGFDLLKQQLLASRT